MVLVPYVAIVKTRAENARIRPLLRMGPPSSPSGKAVCQGHFMRHMLPERYVIIPIHTWNQSCVVVCSCADPAQTPRRPRSKKQHGASVSTKDSMRAMVDALDPNLLEPKVWFEVVSALYVDPVTLLAPYLPPHHRSLTFSNNTTGLIYPSYILRHF